MSKILSKLVLLVFLSSLLAACAPATPTPALDFVPLAPTPTVDLITQIAAMVDPSPTPTLPPTATPAPTPTLVPTQAEPVVLDCVATFEKRELKAPYQRINKTEARYTLSSEELQTLFGRMGMKNMCIPADLGAPFLNAGWDAANSFGMGPAERGFMISLGFEGLYQGAGWSSGFVVAATYDFRAPTEYEIYATPEDYGALKNGLLPNRAVRTFAANGVTGFQRVAAGIGMGRTPLYMTYVLPFEQGYIAVVSKLGDFENDLQPLMDQFSKGQYPQDVAKMVNLFGAVAEHIEKK